MVGQFSLLWMGWVLWMTPPTTHPTTRSHPPARPGTQRATQKTPAPKSPTKTPHKKDTHTARRAPSQKIKTAPILPKKAAQPASNTAPHKSGHKPPKTPLSPTLKSALRQLSSPYGSAPPALGMPPSKTSPLSKDPRHQLPKVQLFSGGALFWVQLFGMLFALGAIVATIYLVLRWISKQAGFPGQVNRGLLSIQDRIALEPQKGLLVVEAAGDYFLLATHEQGVTLLKQLDAQAIETWQSGQPNPQPFWKRLRQKQNNTSSPDEAPKSAIPTQFEVVSDGQTIPPKTETD